MSNIFILSLKNYFKKKTSILNALLISITLLIVISVNTYSNTAINFLESNNVSNSVYFHSLEVIPPSSENLEDALEKVKNIEHITVATKMYEYQAQLQSDELKNENIAGNITLFYASNESLPEITYGSNFPNDNKDNYIICPENLNATPGWNEISSVSKFSSINMKNFLNKEITFKYYSAKDIFEEKYTVIGLYKPKVYIDTRVCFAPASNVSRIVINQYSDILDEITHISKINDQESLSIQIDDLSNKDEVIKEINNLGYKYNEVSSIDSTFYYNIRNNMAKISLVTLIILSLILIILFLKQFNDDQNFYQLIKFLGYTEKSRNKILIINNFITLFMSILITMVVLLVALIIFKIVLTIYPYLIFGWEIKIDYMSIIYIIIILINSLIISSIINIFRMKYKGVYK